MMMNRGQIMDLGVKAAEAVGLDADVQAMLLNLSIRRLAKEFRWPHLLTPIQDVFAAGQQTKELPTDYLKTFSLKMFIDSSGNSLPLRELSLEEMDRLRYLNNQAFNGRPRMFCIDKMPTTMVSDSSQLVQHIVLDKKPDTNYSYQLRYYREPVWVDPTGDDTYRAQGVPIDDYLLLEAFKYQIMDYMNDESANQQWVKTETFVKQYLISQSDLSAGQDRVALDRDTYETPIYTY